MNNAATAAFDHQGTGLSVSSRPASGRWTRCGTLGAVEDFSAANKASWDDRVPAHAASPDYSVDSFIADPAFLSEVVRFDLPMLGDISGLRGVHLQCHIGTDTISLARLGASMTGVDFSGPAIRHARALAEQTGADATFIESDVYDAAEAAGHDVHAECPARQLCAIPRQAEHGCA